MLEIKGKCGVCQMEFRRPSAARVPAGYCTACWEKADRHLQERDDLADFQAAQADSYERRYIPPADPKAAEVADRACARQARRDALADRQEADPAGHYHHVVRAPIADEDIARGYTEAKLDPYRVCDIYATGGGPREQMIKKLLRWTDKGQAEDKVIAEIESALKRWKEMREEDAACR